MNAPHGRPGHGRSGWPVLVALASLVLGAAAVCRAEHSAVRRAEQAIAAGDVVPERDLAPLMDALRTARGVDEKRQLVDAIAELGAADGDSPNAVKSYLLEAAPPVLLDVAENGGDPFLQGDALFALRGMRAPRAVLERAAAVAEAAPDAYVRSRGEILRGFIRTMPVEDGAGITEPVDPERAGLAVDFLDRRGISVSTQALRDAARRADADVVKALLEAGVTVDTGVRTLSQTPLYFAISLACISQGAETDWLVTTVRLLVDAGADLTMTDDNDNTVLNLAAHWCGPKIVGLLVDAGAEIDHRNGSGISPLGLALIRNALETAEVLVAKGARLGAEEAAGIRRSATDPRARTLIEKASGGAH